MNHVETVDNPVTLTPSRNVTEDVSIQMTYDYSKFSRILGNRSVEDPAVNRIIQYVKQGVNLLPAKPVLVTEDFRIVDGQHRYEASKRLNLPIYYVVVHNVSLSDIAKLNSAQKAWRTTDYMECYAEVGAKPYLLLKSFCKDWGVHPSKVLEILSNNVNWGEVYGLFKEGEFQITSLETATEVLRNAKIFAPYFRYWDTKNFLRAIQKITRDDDYDPKRMAKKLEIVAARKLLQRKHNAHEYIVMIESIYNFSTRGENRVRFNF